MNELVFRFRSGAGTLSQPGLVAVHKVTCWVVGTVNDHAGDARGHLSVVRLVEEVCQPSAVMPHQPASVFRGQSSELYGGRFGLRV